MSAARRSARPPSRLPALPPGADARPSAAARAGAHRSGRAPRLPDGPARGRPAARADRRAHAPRRARGELLVPAPPRRLRVDRARASAACASSTWRAARATAPTCWRAPPRTSSASTRTPRRYEHARREVRARRRALRAHADRHVRRAVRRRRRSSRRSSTSTNPGEILEHFAGLVAGSARRRSTSRRRTCSRSRRRAPSARATRGTCTSTAPQEFRALCAEHFGARRAATASSTPACCAAHQVAIERLGWDAVHARLGHHRSRSTTGSRRRSPTRDFALREPTATSTRALDFLAVCRP